MVVVVSIPPHAEFGPNDHRKEVPHSICESWEKILIILGKIVNMSDKN